jgi:hypothetical protein
MLSRFITFGMTSLREAMTRSMGSKGTGAAEGGSLSIRFGDWAQTVCTKFSTDHEARMMAN